MSREIKHVLQSLRDHATLQAEALLDGNYTVAGKEVTLKSHRLVKAVSEVCPDTVTAWNRMVTATATLRKYLPLASSPAAIMLAWSWREETLTTDMALHLADAGGVMIPESQSDPVLRPQQKGLMLVDDCLFGIRHAPGNYPDAFTPDGRLEYQPTVNKTGPTNHLSLVRFRWAELLASKSLPGGILLWIMWLKYPPLRTNLMMVCPALVESLKEPWTDHIASPLQLRLLSQYEAWVRSGNFVLPSASLEAAVSLNWAPPTKN